MIKRRAALGALIPIFLLASWLSLLHIDSQSIWFDEGWSAFAAGQPTVWDAARADLTNPPLYYMLLHLSAQLWGTSEFALRWFSTLMGLLTLALIGRLARQSGGRMAGVVAVYIGAVSALLWWASQEARMYTLLAFLIALAALSWQQLVNHPTRWAWLGVCGAQLALLYAHNSGPIAVLWLNAATLLLWISRRNAHQPEWRFWIASQLLVGLLWLPWLGYFLQLREANSALNTGPQLSIQLLWDVWQGFALGVWSLINETTPLTLLALAALAIYAIAFPYRSRMGRWLGIHSLILTAGLIAGLMVLGNELHGRYLTMIAPLPIAALGIGLAQLRPAVLRLMLLVPLTTLFGFVWFTAQDPLYQHDDARSMVQYYAETLGPEDTVIAWSYADRYELAYYWDRLNVIAQRITLPEGTDLDIVWPLLPKTGTVSLNVWYTQRADFRGMLPCIYGHLNRQTPQIHTVYGMTDQRYLDTALIRPGVQTADITFGLAGSPIARVTSITALPESAPDQSLCLPITIQITQPTSEPLKAAIILRTQDNRQIAQADAIFATADQRTTDGVTENTFLTAYPLITLPYGSPPGSYEVYLRLYSDSAWPSGLEPINPIDITAGRDLLLGTLSATQATQWQQSSRASDLPYRVDLDVDAVWRLISHDQAIDGPRLQNGARQPIALLWEGRGTPPTLNLSDSLGRWEVAIPSNLSDVNGTVLDWRTFQVPLDADSGTAQLLLPDGTVIGQYPIDVIPAISDPPAVQQAVDVAFDDIGRLVGYTLNSTQWALNENPTITLVWHAEQEQIARDYTVFVQLLDANGTLIGQSDSVPGQGTRPTSGWRVGEYIIDPHTLTFNANAQPGPAHLIVGLYDPQNNQRLLTTQALDYAALPAEVSVR